MAIERQAQPWRDNEIRGPKLFEAHTANRIRNLVPSTGFAQKPRLIVQDDDPAQKGKELF
jgi:hypothetical protein